MPWVRLDSSFPEHPKVIGLSPSAFRLYVTMLCYAARNATDGYVPTEAIHGGNNRRAATELVTAKLWDPHPDHSGWHVHDFLEWQESNAERAARRRAAKHAANARWHPEP
jgi:hypothetical protein